VILKAGLILNQLAQFNMISPVRSDKGKGAPIVTTVTFDLHANGFPCHFKWLSRNLLLNINIPGGAAVTV
jgi:hypothetical protein